MKIFTFNFTFPHGDIGLFDPLCKVSSSDFGLCSILSLPPLPHSHPVSSSLPSMLPVLKAQTRVIFWSILTFYSPQHPPFQLHPQTNNSQVRSTALGYFTATGPSCTFLLSCPDRSLDSSLPKHTFSPLSVDMPPVPAQFQKPRLWESSSTPHSLILHI